MQLEREDARAEVMVLDGNKTLWDNRTSQIATIVVTLSRVEITKWAPLPPHHRIR